MEFMGLFAILASFSLELRQEDPDETWRKWSTYDVVVKQDFRIYRIIWMGGMVDYIAQAVAVGLLDDPFVL